MIVDVVTGAEPDEAADPDSYARATLNILADFSEEKSRLADSQRAMLNILEDSDVERRRLEGAQKATLNILADFSEEGAKLADVQKAVLNILQDFAGEKARLESMQRALLNILEDLDAEDWRSAELEASNRELEAFSYSVSHDLRAPLRAIEGFSRVLAEDHAARLDAEGLRVLGVVTENTRRMGELIDDLLGFARIARQQIDPTVIDMTRLARLVVAECRQLEPGRDVTVTIDPLPVARGDQPMVRQALVNLVSNAFKFTRPRPDARIEIGGEEGPTETTYLVRDNGVGFDPRYADQLFKVFQRLHSSTEFEGTGIGLAIVARIARRHGGRAWADGIEGAGATFAFALPREGGTDDA